MSQPDGIYADSLAASRARFWAIIEGARLEARTCRGKTSAVEQRLRAIPIAEVLEFHVELRRWLAESYTWDLWAVAYLANGGASDDGFDYFRGWLLTQGRERYEAAMKDPARAVEGTFPIGLRECEGILGVGYVVYRERTGAEPPEVHLDYPMHPLGTRWNEDRLEEERPELARRVGRWSWFSWLPI